VNIAQGILPFQLLADQSKTLVTSFAGLPLLMETFRALGLPEAIGKHLSLLRRPGTYEEADYVESFLPFSRWGAAVWMIFIVCVRMRV
jgi:hypothetical protein